jgi:hypothetical protein
MACVLEGVCMTMTCGIWHQQEFNSITVVKIINAPVILSSKRVFSTQLGAIDCEEASDMEGPGSFY